MKSHKEVLNYLCRNKEVLEKALGLPYIWVRSKEYPVSNLTDERADLVFQDKFDAYKGQKDAICFVLELKKDKGDHELLGQVKKYMHCLEKCIKYGHWGKVKGITLARKYTDSGIDLLWRAGIRTFVYNDATNGGINIKEKKIKRTAV